MMSRACTVPASNIRRQHTLEAMILSFAAGPNSDRPCCGRANSGRVSSGRASSGRASSVRASSGRASSGRASSGRTPKWRVGNTKHFYRFRTERFTNLTVVKLTSVQTSLAGTVTDRSSSIGRKRKSMKFSWEKVFLQRSTGIKILNTSHNH